MADGRAACIDHLLSGDVTEMSPLQGFFIMYQNPKRVKQTFRLVDVASLMKHAPMSSTYKPALLKALVRICARDTHKAITLETLGDEFASMYWNQTVVYHLRQASSLSKESEVIRLIRNTADEFVVRSFVDLPEVGRSRIRRKMAQILTINVLEAFHSSKPPHMLPLFRWEKGSSLLQISNDAAQFLREEAPLLVLIANYHWATFLEGCNKLAPRIIQKVERDAARRASLKRYLMILLAEDDRRCFYCGTSVGGQSAAQVDHVIPWSFLLEDPLWNLVLACRRCNGAKSDWLPERKYIDLLSARNAIRLKSKLAVSASPLLYLNDLNRLYEAAISVEWPRFWRPLD